MRPPTRRDLLRASAGFAGASLIPGAARAEEAANDDRPLPTRLLGRTGMRVAILAQGGQHLGTLEEKDAIAQVHRAIDLGVNFFDNAHVYNDGRSEELLGKALAGGKRQKVFVMTKSGQRMKDGAARQLDESLKRLQTDHVDLWQFHAVPTVREVEQIWGAGGAMEAAQAAKRAGKIRHIGLTGHRDPAAHLRALDFEGLEAIQMPLNPLDFHFRSFQEKVPARARAKGVGVIAMKSLCMGTALENAVYTADEALPYVWGLDVDVLVSGMTSIEQLEYNVKLAKSFKPLPPAARQALLARVKPHIGIEVEHYKRPGG